MRNRVEEIRSKSSEVTVQSKPAVPTDYGKIRVGAKKLDDATLQLGDYRKVDSKLGSKQYVLKAIKDYDLKAMREISLYYYRTSGIYARVLRYMAFMYRYDWFITPFINEDKVDEEYILKNFHGCLNTLDDYQVKKVLGDIALEVLKKGCYYGYRVDSTEGEVLQELPVNFCRSRFNVGKKPAVEFNMKFFDTFTNADQKLRILKMFPEEFMRGYALFKQGKLPPEFPGSDSGWYLLDPEKTVKFTANGEDYPAFISAIPLILDLDAAQDLDRKKTMQRLLKLVIQKMPLDKNGDLIFDVDEAQQLHNNAVQMLSRAIGVDVLTTFAEVDVANIADNTAASAQSDDLERVERQVYNDIGVSQNQFNADGNIALEKSGLNDESTMYNLLLQFEYFLNELIAEYNKKPKKVKFKVQLLTTTIYNYKEIAKLYKEQVQLGYSKMLPQIAMGQSQSSILANAFFENKILNLSEVFIPPMSSNTMSNKAAGGSSSSNSSNSQAGRPQKEEGQKSDKTIANQQSMG